MKTYANNTDAINEKIYKAFSEKAFDAIREGDWLSPDEDDIDFEVYGWELVDEDYELTADDYKAIIADFDARIKEEADDAEAIAETEWQLNQTYR